MFSFTIFDFFRALIFTLTIVPSGFNIVWYSSSLLEFLASSLSGFPNPKKGINKDPPKIGSIPLLEIIFFFLDLERLLPILRGNLMPIMVFH